MQVETLPSSGPHVKNQIVNGKTCKIIFIFFLLNSIIRTLTNRKTLHKKNDMDTKIQYLQTSSALLNFRDQVITEFGELLGLLFLNGRQKKMGVVPVL